ncbi:putative E3 ubiquitin-protein ligase ARI7 [Nicotiana tabacum]|uniref:RBR-type E3 ubiquitin transferase n=1 Tax=Nicotiana tabacum TaxID=4097 RepID=A0A1S4CBG1_TOBAC
MESDDDMYGGSDVDSAAGDDFYGDDVNTGNESDVDSAGGGDDFIGNDSDHLCTDKNYVVLSDDDIRHLMDDDISKVSSVLSVSKTEASILLRRYSWSVNKVHEEWFADESKVRAAVGLKIAEKIVQFPENKLLTCGICFEDYSSDGILASACGHPFCVECWRGYISNSISDGSGCLNLRCPEPSCKVAVTQDIIDSLTCDDDRKKYYGFLFSSYVEENRKIRWCPAPGCNFAVQFDIGSDNCDVICDCSHSFCWNCTEEAHRPVDCETVGKWKEKNLAESENTNWILAYTKPCPQCKRPIEKNEGCMRMTCRDPCKYRFCWLCLNSWSTHGYNPCNKYKPGNEDEKKKEMAKQSIEKYTHYYERWATNEKSRQKAVKDLRRMGEVNVKELSELQGITETQLKFIIEAWNQIVECRRVLKWTYAYGFFLPDEEHTKRQFFEFSQGQAEVGLERLHHCAESELENYLNVEESNSKTFDDFRIKLTGLTSVTKNYFDNLVRALENGLEDVHSQGAQGDMPTSSKNAAESSKRASLKNGRDRMPLKARAEFMRLVRTRNAGLPGINNTASSKHALVFPGGNINGSKNLVINGDNTLRKSNNPLVAGGSNFMGSKDALVAARSYPMSPQFLQLAGLSSTTGSSNLQLAGGSKVMNIGGGSVTNLANAHMAGRNNLTVPKNPLEAGDSNFMGSKDAPVAGRSYAMGTKFLQQAGVTSTTGSSNLQLAGGGKVMNIGGGSVTNLTNAHVARSNNLTVSKRPLEAGGSNLMGSKNALAAARSYVMGSQVLQQAGVTSTTGSSNLQLAGGSKVMNIGRGTVPNLANAHVAGTNNLTVTSTRNVAWGSKVMNFGGGGTNLANAHVAGSNNLTVSKTPNAAWGSKVMNTGGIGTNLTNAHVAGSNNLTASKTPHVAGGSNVMNIGGRGANLANSHVAGTNNLSVSKTPHMAGSSSRIGGGKKRRTSNAGTPLIINLDDDDLGETTSTAGASLTQNLIDDLEGWACDSCTFLNASSATACLMCSEDASGSWECEICTFVNKKHASACQMCEHRR